MHPPEVPVADPGREYAELRAELEPALLGVAASGRYILGPELDRFESELAAYVGVPHVVGVASGTDALLLALRALGIGPGDEVITSPFTFFATAGAVVHAGATPVFADIRADSFQLDPTAAEAAVTPRTAALLPVHLFGQMAEMEAFRDIARRHGLALVEDAAQAIGAWRETSGPGGSRFVAGAAADAGCFSFYPTKNLGGLGDGGCVTTADPAVADRLRRLRVHGRQGEGYHHAEVGYNSRLDDIQAAVLRVKLRYLDAWTESRRAHAAVYAAALGGPDGPRPPVTSDGNRHTYHQYTVRCATRDEAIRRLRADRIGSAVYYPVPLHLQEAFAHLGYGEGSFPEAEGAAREVLSLPVFPGLEPEERDRVASALRRL